jgi:hypothetical protein
MAAGATGPERSETAATACLELVGPGPQLVSKVNQKYHLAGHSFGCPVSSSYIRLPAGWDTRGCISGRGDDQDGADLGFASRAWWQQAEVAVGDPAGLQDLAVDVGAELCHWLYSCAGGWAMPEAIRSDHDVGIELSAG